jgi:hypothetical protein
MVSERDSIERLIRVVTLERPTKERTMDVDDGTVGGDGVQ